MAMVHMKRSKKERKEDGKMPSNIGGDDYPYGLSVHLDHDSLDKLGMDKLPSVGDKVHLQSHAHVKEVREEHRDGGKKHRHVTLELRHLSIGPHKADDYEHSTKAAKGAKAVMDKAIAGKGIAPSGEINSEED